MIDLVNRRLNRGSSHGAKAESFYTSGSVNSLRVVEKDEQSVGPARTLDTADCTEDLTSMPELNTSLHLPNLYEDEEFDESQVFGETSTRSFVAPAADKVVANTKIIAPRGSIQQTSRNSMNAINQLKFSKLDRLYGRDKEVKLQRDLYVQAKENSTRQLILISGEAGVGKSVLAEELRPVVRKDCGFFLSGKFDQQQQDEPYSAISTACIELMHALMEHKHSRSNPHGWKFSFQDIQQKLCDAMDPDQIELLSNIIPSLARVTGGDFLNMGSNHSFGSALDTESIHSSIPASERFLKGHSVRPASTRRRGTGMQKAASDWSIGMDDSSGSGTERNMPSTRRSRDVDIQEQPSSRNRGMQKMASDWSLGLDSSSGSGVMRRQSSERTPRGGRRNGILKRMASEWSVSRLNNDASGSFKLRSDRNLRGPQRTTSGPGRTTGGVPQRTSSGKSKGRLSGDRNLRGMRGMASDRSIRGLRRMTSEKSLRGSATGNFADTKACLHFAFRQLFGVLSACAPTVFLLNDLQWADAASMELVESLLLDRTLTGKGFVLVGSYRSEAVSSTDLLMTTMRDVESIAKNNSDMNLHVTNIVVGNLTEDQVDDMLCDLLSCEDDECRNLAEIVHRKTNGNVFFVVHFLKNLSSEGLLAFSIVSLKWTWDVEKIKLAGSATVNVIDLMKDKLKKLPTQVCRTLPFVACLGASFRRSIFNLVVDHFNKTFSSREIADFGSEVYPPSDFYSVCHKAGFLVSNSKGDTIHWEHDKVQEAALALTNEEELFALRSRLGEVLLHKLSKHDLEKSIFVVISMLDMNSAQGNRRKQIRFAELNLLAGTKAMTASASATAAAHLTQGINCLPENHWETDPELSLNLYSMAVEALFCIGQFEKMNAYCQEVFQCKELDMLSKARVYNPHVLAMMAEGRFGDAIKKCVEILAELGCKFPRFFRSVHMLLGVIKAQKKAKKKVEQMVNDEKVMVMEEEKDKWIMFLLDTLCQAAHQGHSNLFFLSNIRGLQYTLKYGVCDWAPPLLAVIGNVLVAGLGDFDGAQFYGEAAMDLFESTDISKSAFSRTSFIASYFVLPHRVASAACRKMALQGYQAGMKSGDVQNALWCALSYLDISFYVSQNLDTLAADCQIYCQQMKSLKHERIAKYLECLWQLVLNVNGSAEDPTVLNGTGLNYDEYMKFAERTESIQAIYYYDRYHIAASFWSCDFPNVYTLILKTDTHKGFYEKTFGGSFALYPLYFQCALSLLSLYQTTKKKKYKTMATFFSGKLSTWAKKGNPNFKHYSLIVDAEFLEIQKKSMEAEKMLKEAVVFAGRRGFTNDQALANERLSGFFLRQGLDDDAKYHLEEAIKLYRQWGAHAKCKILHNLNTKLLPPIPPEIVSNHGPTANASDDKGPVDSHIEEKGSAPDPVDVMLDKAMIHPSARDVMEMTTIASGDDSEEDTTQVITPEVSQNEGKGLGDLEPVDFREERAMIHVSSRDVMAMTTIASGDDSEEDTTGNPISTIASGDGSEEKPTPTITSGDGSEDDPIPIIPSRDSSSEDNPIPIIPSRDSSSEDNPIPIMPSRDSTCSDDNRLSTMASF